jgi:hypothetical protein
VGASIADFGKDAEGVNLYRVNGTKADIEKTITILKDVGCEVREPFELEKSFQEWSVLLKVRIPEEVTEK